MDKQFITHLKKLKKIQDKRKNTILKLIHGNKKMIGGVNFDEKINYSYEKILAELLDAAKNKNKSKSYEAQLKSLMESISSDNRNFNALIENYKKVVNVSNSSINASLPENVKSTLLMLHEKHSRNEQLQLITITLTNILTKQRDACLEELKSCKSREKNARSSLLFKSVDENYFSSNSSNSNNNLETRETWAELKTDLQTSTNDVKDMDSIVYDVNIYKNYVNRIALLIKEDYSGTKLKNIGCAPTYEKERIEKGLNKIEKFIFSKYNKISHDNRQETANMIGDLLLLTQSLTDKYENKAKHIYNRQLYDIIIMLKELLNKFKLYEKIEPHHYTQ